MRFQQHEIRTGLLVLLTLGILVATIIYLAAPGVFKPLTIYEVFFDTASGLRQGAPVQLAGRGIGTVTNIRSPVPREQRPKGKPELEAMVEVTVDQSARIYNRNSVRMQQIGLLGDIVVDFSRGDETSGLAQPGTAFIGERQTDFNEAIPKMVAMLEPVAAEATKTMKQFQDIAENLRSLTDKQGELNQALSNVTDLGENLVEITDQEGPVNLVLTRLNKSLADVNQITESLSKSDDIQVTLQNFRRSSQRLDSTLQSTQRTLDGLSSGLDQSLRNFEQFTDTVKRQPWRLIWPTTKKYPEDVPRQARRADPAPIPPRKR